VGAIDLPVHHRRFSIKNLYRFGLESRLLAAGMAGMRVSFLVEEYRLEFLSKPEQGGA
jgi:hypothetical protein